MSSGVANNEEDKKPTDQGGAHINLKVKGQDGNEVFFRIKRSTQLKKLMNAYCDRQSVDFNAIAFLFDGRRLRAEQTPDELEMEDGDEIDAMLHQTGGSVLLSIIDYRLAYDTAVTAGGLCKGDASFVNMIMSEL
ncbi:hypothetical protein TSUD_129630 [Trifolium subterraneum]|uniref:Ubiquitin-like domain-containing protein n=1 Tax=Trifolium subterraneum TaxID=3900 RepID=A0A2Z6LTT8_TRISU|nr:hypothetical protein TSUD_129630 [Trifolium subterraneum]